MTISASFMKKHTFQMNDTHPTVAVAELMRILLDEYDLEWDEAWDVTTKTCAYTNHTIMAEALEKWPIDLFSRLLPRIYQIIQEIDRRFVHSGTKQQYPGNEERMSKMAIFSDGQVRMATSCNRSRLLCQRCGKTAYRDSETSGTERFL